MTIERAETERERREQDSAGEIERLWAARDPLALAGDAARHLNAGSATDWGLPATIETPVPPITLGGGIPDPGSLPRADLLEAMQRALAVADDSPLRYGGGIGYEPLREALAQRYTRDQGVPVDAGHFMLTNGSAGAIDLVCKTFLSPGDVVISESPTFSGTLRTFRGNQAEIVSVSMDEEGLNTAELEATLRRLAAEGRRVKLIYTIATFHNPTGIAMSLERRHELLRIAGEHGVLVLEDDAYGDLYYGDAPPPLLSALGGGYGVITVRTFSKIIATGLRIGWIHSRPDIVALISRMRFDMGNSPMLLHMLARYMEGGHLDEHLRAMRPLYAEKAGILAGALTEFAEPYLTFDRPQGGFFLWVRLQHGLTAEAVQRAGLQEGVVFPRGHAFFPDGHDPDGEHIRLAYSWTAKEDLREAAERLARACARAAEEN